MTINYNMTNNKDLWKAQLRQIRSTSHQSLLNQNSNQSRKSNQQSASNIMTSIGANAQYIPKVKQKAQQPLILNQRAFLAFRRSKRIKHLDQKWGNKPRFESNMDHVSFLNALLSKYDHRMRPSPSRSSKISSLSSLGANKIPTFVLIDMYINNLGGISEVTMDYETNVFLRLTWFDSRLNFQSYYDAFEISVPDAMINKIWKPDPFFVNEKSAKLHNIPMPTKFLRIRKDGKVTWSVRISMRLACVMNLRKFPMDVQLCHMQVQSFAYQVDQLQFFWASKNTVEMPNELELPQYELRGYKVSTCQLNYTVNGEFSCIQLSLILNRSMGYCYGCIKPGVQ